VYYYLETGEGSFKKVIRDLTQYSGSSPFFNHEAVQPWLLIILLLSSAPCLAQLASTNNQLWSQATAGVTGDPEATDNFGHAVTIGDFNGDGWSDLAIGAPSEGIGAIQNAGGVHVLYGTPNRLSSAESQFLDQSISGSEGSAEEGDWFGKSLTSGDFNGDGYDDLAVGVPFEDIGLLQNAGAVHVFYGSQDGLTLSNDKLWHQDSANIQDDAEEDETFGSSLASGDFNGDGYDDLAIGVPREEVRGRGREGAIHVIFGSMNGLWAEGNQYWHRDSEGVEGDPAFEAAFGASLAVGDFDGDGQDDLAIGVPGDFIGTLEKAGTVHVLLGSENGLTAVGNQVWSQNLTGIRGEPKRADRFGGHLASGDFDGNGRDDLAISVTGEDLGDIDNAGAVAVIYSGESGLNQSGDQLWSQNSAGILNSAENGDAFGVSLAAGDFNADGRDDLVIGVPNEDIGDLDKAGATHIFYGGQFGLSAAGNQFWYQGENGIRGTAEMGDRFGFALATGDLNGDGADDLAIGADTEDINTIEDAGAINVLYAKSPDPMIFKDSFESTE